MYVLTYGDTPIDCDNYLEPTAVVSEKNWTGMPYHFYGSEYIWSDGTNTYYTYTSTYQVGDTFVIDPVTSTWSSTDLGAYSDGRFVWKYDGTIYYSDSSSAQYVFDRSRSRWSTMSWTSGTPGKGNKIWSDGTDAYYSSGSTQRYLDISTLRWRTMSWNGLTSFSGQHVWSDGENIYVSNGSSTQYILDKSTHTWYEKTWGDVVPASASLIWSNGYDTFYSDGSSHYILDKTSLTFKPFYIGINFSGTSVWRIGSTCYVNTSYTSGNYTQGYEIAFAPHKKTLISYENQ